MEQAALLAIIGTIYEKLVADVASRVQQQLNDDSLRSDWIDARIKLWASVNFDDCANAWAEDAFDSLAENWIENNLDLEDAAREAVQNSDHLADLIRETVKNDLTFTVSVD